MYLYPLLLNRSIIQRIISIMSFQLYIIDMEMQYILQITPLSLVESTIEF